MAPWRDDGFQRGLITPRRFGELYVTTRQPQSRPLMAFGHKQRESVVRVVPVRWIRVVIPFRGADNAARPAERLRGVRPVA